MFVTSHIPVTSKAALADVGDQQVEIVSWTVLTTVSRQKIEVWQAFSAF